MVIAVPATREVVAVAYTGVGLYMSLHSADPGTTGANELTGGSPPYARQQVAWAPGTPDGIVPGASVNFNIPAGVAVTHVGLWDAATGGTFRDKAVGAINAQSTQTTVAVTPTVTVL